jgi:AraC family transcriptional regulator
MGEFASYADWYAAGRLASYLRERRAGGDAVPMIEVGQPAGDMSDPATADFILTKNLSQGLAIHGDFGAGRFRARAPRGALFLSPAYVATDIVIDAPHALRCFTFNAQRYATALDEMRPSAAPLDFGRLHAGHFESLPIVQLIDRLWEVAAEPSASTRLHAEGAVLVILAELSRLADAPVATAKRGLAPWQLRRVISYMRDNLERNVGVQELADVVNLSRFYFCTAFRLATGCTPHERLTQLRIERARSLLADGSMPITEIALTIGYQTPSAFAASFRKLVGVTPSAFRNARKR